jgi:hypothetical protein
MRIVAFVSFTRLHLRSWRYLPSFVLYAHRSSRQAQRSSGYVIGALSADPVHLTFWTATLWGHEAAMRAYQFASPHKEVMLKIGTWCDEAAVAHRTQLSQALPGSAEALEFMQQHGRVTRLPAPSSGHTAGLTVPDGRPPRFAPLRAIRGG